MRSGPLFGEGKAMTQEYVSGSATIPGFGPLKLLTSEEIFNPNSPSTAVCASPGGGKTVSAVAAVYANKDIGTGFFYITNSYDHPRNTYLQKMIPSIHVKLYSIEFLSQLWSDILTSAAENGSVMADANVESFVKRRCEGNPGYMSMMMELRRKYEELKAQFSDSPGLKDALYVCEMEAKVSFIRNTFSLADRSLSPPEAKLVLRCQSSTPLPVLIFDDITAELSAPLTGKYTIPRMTESGMEFAEMRGGDAQDYLLHAILTTTRQVALVAFFIHDLKTFSPEIRQSFGAFVMDGQAVEEVCRLRTINDEGKRLIAAAWAVIGDPNKYKHYKVVYTSNPSITTHGQMIALYKPPYITTPEPLGTPTYRLLCSYIQASISRFQQGQLATATQQGQEEAKKKALLALAGGPPLSPPISPPISPPLPLSAPSSIAPLRFDPSAGSGERKTMADLLS